MDAVLFTVLPLCVNVHLFFKQNSVASVVLAIKIVYRFKLLFIVEHNVKVNLADDSSFCVTL